jgi:hypothetical protein
MNIGKLSDFLKHMGIKVMRVEVMVGQIF